MFRFAHSTFKSYTQVEPQILVNKDVITISQLAKQLLIILSGVSDNNIRFSDLCRILDTFGFECRIKGSHHIYYKEGIDEIINLQPKGNKAKDYQVKQVRNLVIKYKLGGMLDV